MVTIVLFLRLTHVYQMLTSQVLEKIKRSMLSMPLSRGILFLTFLLLLPFLWMVWIFAICIRQMVIARLLVQQICSGNAEKMG
nr:hypothetical protein [Tanacetum cinerariifolium]